MAKLLVCATLLIAVACVFAAEMENPEKYESDSAATPVNERDARFFHGYGGFGGYRGFGGYGFGGYRGFGGYGFGGYRGFGGYGFGGYRGFGGLGFGGYRGYHWG